MRLNNKGVVVSTVLYTLLIAFLLFLGVTISMLATSADIIASSTKDLVNGEQLEAVQVHEKYEAENFADYDGTSSEAFGSGKACGTDYKWYEVLEKDKYGRVALNDDGTDIKGKKNSDALVKINTKYGTMYWPRDFDPNYSNITFSVDEQTFQSSSSNKTTGVIKVFKVDKAGGNFYLPAGKLNPSPAEINSEKLEMYEEFENLDSDSDYGYLIFYDTLTKTADHVVLRNVCPNDKI